MSPKLARQSTAEDILQEAMLRAWRSRADLEWRGLRSFRSWLLTIIDHCIRDAAQYFGAKKRGGGRPAVPFSTLSADSGQTSHGSVFAGPVATTTPSRIAIHAEQAAAMEAALAELPEDVREVVRLRLFEQRTMQEIAEGFGIGLSAARHRFLKGAEIYYARLRAQLASRSVSAPGAAIPAPLGEDA